MWQVTSLAGAIPAVILGMLTLGLMPMCWKHLELRGRCFGHTMMDFAFVSLFGGCGAGLLFGSVPSGTFPGNKPNIIPQFSQANGQLAAFGVVCGMFFTFADVALQQAMPLVGIVTAAGISNALRIIISVLCNYWLDQELNDPKTLFPGLGLALIAIAFSTAAQIDHRKSHKRRTTLTAAQAETLKGGVAHQEVTDITTVEPCKQSSHAVEDHTVVTLAPKPADVAAGQTTIIAIQDGDDEKTGCLPFQLSSRAALIKGLVLSATCGVSYGLYSPAFNIATNDPFHLLSPDVPPLGEWLALFYLYVGLSFMSFVINTILLYRPSSSGGPPSSIKLYCLDWGRDRMFAILSGIFGLISAVAELIGGQAGGYAFASLVAAYPLVTTILGILIFKEFQHATRQTQVLLAGQFLFYLAAIVMLASSARLRNLNAPVG